MDVGANVFPFENAQDFGCSPVFTNVRRPRVNGDKRGSDLSMYHMDSRYFV